MQGMETSKRWLLGGMLSQPVARWIEQDYVEKLDDIILL